MAERKIFITPKKGRTEAKIKAFVIKLPATNEMTHEQILTAIMKRVNEDGNDYIISEGEEIHIRHIENPF